MMRFDSTATLPMPPIVSQNSALNPDGSPDPSHSTDCGEACLASILQVHTSFALSPGCIRQALGLPSEDGRTMWDELCLMLNRMGVQSWPTAVRVGDLWPVLAQLRHHGRYAILLGNWLDEQHLHWVIAAQRSSDHVSVMDPWNALYANYGRAWLEEHYQGACVVAKLRQPIY